ncbi:hypothetical protein PAXRUDRAFT_829526 [Paxillus rubicundulus Ve08.2h10]|uniref:Uncharacterized protein n=1 Tax=Paxillus rubicundulus Ve08.2h10 TaxID=930991 RepID=A0A0D0E006_9AGAM|nr:hypothetical protein PAXRUDRAFT_829526 [Paxillus rubicundulus Ve08.2h10]
MLAISRAQNFAIKLEYRRRIMEDEGSNRAVTKIPKRFWCCKEQYTFNLLAISRTQHFYVKLECRRHVMEDGDQLATVAEIPE